MRTILFPGDSLYGHQSCANGRHFPAIESAGIPEGQCLARRGCGWCLVHWAWVVPCKRPGLHQHCAAYVKKIPHCLVRALVILQLMMRELSSWKRQRSLSYISRGLCGMDLNIWYEASYIKFVIWGYVRDVFVSFGIGIWTGEDWRRFLWVLMEQTYRELAYRSLGILH